MRAVSGLAAVVLATGAMAQSNAGLGGTTWIAEGHELTVLSSQPAICRSPAAGIRRFAIGRGLFNAPFLLGGQAARAQVSCASCHTNGRRNPHFFLEGVSSEPGTADVSSSFFSPARSNHVFDPRPIPDLALPGRVSRGPASGEMERFLRALIVEEFAGQEPSDAALGALADYVRAIGPCPDEGSVPVELSDQLGLLRDSIEAAAWFGRRGEGDTSAVLISGARHQLGLIHERFAGHKLGKERRLLRAASRKLQPIAQATSTDAAGLESWLSDFEARIAPRLMRGEARSLYNPVLLEIHLRKPG